MRGKKKANDEKKKKKKKKKKTGKNFPLLPLLLSHLLRPLPAHLHPLEERRQLRVGQDALVEDVHGVDQRLHAADAVEEGRQRRRGCSCAVGRRRVWASASHRRI